MRDANEQQVAALARATELAELRYAQGDIAYLELLDVRRGLFQAQIDLVAAQRDALLNTVDLALAVGGGLGRQGRAAQREALVSGTADLQPKRSGMRSRTVCSPTDYGKPERATRQLS